MHTYVIHTLLCEYVKIVYVWYACIIINTNSELTICALLDIHAMFLLFIWMDNISTFFKLYLESWSFLNLKKKEIKVKSGNRWSFNLFWQIILCFNLIGPDSSLSIFTFWRGLFYSQIEWGCCHTIGCYKGELNDWIFSLLPQLYIWTINSHPLSNRLDK